MTTKPMQTPWYGRGEEPKPNWDAVAWASTLDNRFMIEVQRVEPYKGELCIFDHKDGDKELYRETVGISYDALFGADVGDVDEWQDKAASWVDENIYHNDGTNLPINNE